MGNWRRHSREYKQAAVEQMKACANIHELARELGVERKLLYTWKYQFEGRPEKNHLNYSGKPAADTVETRLRGEVKELKEALGEKAAQVDFFVSALRRVNRDCKANEASGDPASTPKSGRKRSRRAS